MIMFDEMPLVIASAREGTFEPSLRGPTMVPVNRHCEGAERVKQSA